MTARDLQLFCLAHYHEVGLGGGNISYETHTINGLTALQGLKASDNRLTTWCISQTKIPPEKKLPVLKSLGEDFNWKAHKGTQSLDSLEILSSYYFQKLSENPDALKDYLVELLDGLGGAAFHGTILLGWSLHDNPRDTYLLAEGLAYTAAWWESFCEYTFTPKPEPGPKLVDILRQVRSENKFASIFGPNWHSELPVYQQRVAKLKQHYTNEFIEYAKLWNPQDLQCAAKELIECVTQIYLYAGASDFFLLHGITSAFAVAEIIKLIDDSPSIGLNLLWHFGLAVLYMYVAEGSPDLTPIPLDDLWSWDKITDIVANDASEHQDAHLIKVIYACKVFAKDFPELEQLFQKAATKTLQNDILTISDYMLGVGFPNPLEFWAAYKTPQRKKSNL